VKHLEEQTLLDYWLEGAEADAVEEHVLGCQACAQRLKTMVPIATAMTGLVAEAPPPVLSRAQLDELKATGASIEEMTVPTFGEVLWKHQGHRMLVPHVHIGANREGEIDVEYCKADGEVISMYPRAPWDRASGELILACDSHVALGHEAMRFRVRTRDARREMLADCVMRNVLRT
jgi:hypothetical protein